MNIDRWNLKPSDHPERVSKAVILAAGVGSRLRPFTDKLPKCLVQIAGVPILDNTLAHLAALETEEIVIVVGHHKEVIIGRFGSSYLGMSMTYIVSDNYEKTNNIYSLWLARDHLTQDVLLLEADIFFERAVLERLLSQGGSNLAIVSRHESWMSGTVVSVDARGRIQATIDVQNQEDDFDYTKYFKTANIYLFRQDFLNRYFLPQLEAYITSKDYDEYYESILITLGHRGKNSLVAVDCDDLKWYEIDDESDRLAAEYLFSSGEERYEHVQSQHGDIGASGLSITPTCTIPTTRRKRCSHSLRTTCASWCSTILSRAGGYRAAGWYFDRATFRLAFWWGTGLRN